MSIYRKCVLLFGLLAVGVAAGPVVIRSPDVVSLSVLEERIPSIPLGDFDLSTSHQNEVLFSIGFGTTSGRVGDAYHLEVKCLDCRTTGTASVSTAGVEKNDNIIGDIISFFEDPIETIVEAFDLNVKIDFENVGGHFDFNLFASNTVSYSLPIFQTQSPLGFAISEDVSFGLVLSIDLVFSLTAAIDLEAGFEFSFPESAYITVDPISGDIVDQNFGGAAMNNLPIICTSGSATFKAALRIRVQAGTTVDLFGTGFDFELGVYANLIEYVATIGTSDACELYITESVDLNIGAYAHAVVEIDYKTFGASPAIVTTLLEYPLPSLCLTRPAETGLPTLPTSSISVVTSGDLAISSSSVVDTQTPAAVPTSTVAVSTSLTLPAPSSTSGGIFQEGSSAASTQPTTTFAVSASPTGYSNSTITFAPILTTSTVYATELINITSCSSTVLHCPASLASEVVITSTKILYTTICPVGEVQPATLPSFKPTVVASEATSRTKAIPTNTPIVIVSPIPLTPCATPIVETIYTPTFINPTYAMPTATIFTVAHPNWNLPSAVTSSSAIQVQEASTIIVAPTAIPTSSPSGGLILPPANATTAGSVSTPKPTAPLPFSGASSRSITSSLFGMLLFVAACILV